MRPLPSVLLLLLSTSSSLCRAELRSFDIILAPNQTYVHYTDGYIRAPGYIDLSGLTFTALGQAGGLDSYDVNDDNTVGGNVDDDGGVRIRRHLDGGVEDDASAIDIAVFHLPDECASSRAGCDWTTLGIGIKVDDSLHWCCSSEFMDANECDERNRLIVKDDVFVGTHRFVNVPPTGAMQKRLRYGKFDELSDGRYVVIFANCNDNVGRDIMVTGESVWRSNHGYLPGELFEFMYFYAMLMLVYVLLLAWYGCLMLANRASRIPIEKWIWLTIVLGTLEMVLRTLDYIVWNGRGYRSTVVLYPGVLVGVLKRGVSRCLIVMVALGWGVVRDSLGRTLGSIIVLGAVYIGVSAARDLMIVFAVEDMETLSLNAEEGLIDVVQILTFVVAAVDVFFIMWILDALNSTMLYLETMSQTRKLQRYLKLRCLFLFSILFATIFIIFALVNNYDDDGIVQEEHEWVVDASTEVNYLFVLVGVAWLWRPNPAAKEYAFAMELPAMGGGADNDGETELELTGVVPSAMDDDDDDDDFGKNGFHDGARKNGGFHDDFDDDPANGHDQRFQID